MTSDLQMEEHKGPSTPACTHTHSHTFSLSLSLSHTHTHTHTHTQWGQSQHVLVSLPITQIKKLSNTGDGESATHLPETLQEAAVFKGRKHQVVQEI